MANANFSGIINVYKEAGYTSFDVVARLRGILRIKKIGHTGTLDPMATGVLPVCIGKATKVCDVLTDRDKVYRCKMLLGTDTDTYDTTGTTLNFADVNVSESQITEALNLFTGDIMQKPPIYSALKVDGKRLYEYARAGKEVEIKERPVTIYGINDVVVDLPYVTFTVSCSKGTYIRSLCHDVGLKLGCFGTMDALERLKAGPFTSDEALKLDEIEHIVKDDRLGEIIKPVDSVFDEYEARNITEEAFKYAVNGCELEADEVCGEACSGNIYRLYTHDNRFLGIYKYTDKYKLIKNFYENDNN